MDEILKRLTDKDDKAAYEYAERICTESAETDQYLEMIPLFAGMLRDRSSYVRTRGFLLISSQARWATDGQLDAVLDEMLPLLNDPKPTVVRQCLKALREVAFFRPELTERLLQAVDSIDLFGYRDSMAPLIERDAEELKALLGK